MLLLGNLGQQLDINDTQAALDSLSAQLQAAQRADRSVAQQLDELARENGELKLYVAALLRLLVAKQVVSRDELAGIVDAIDRADGQADGRMQGPLRGQP
jgi:ferritin